MFWNMVIPCFEGYLNCSKIFQAGLSCQLISLTALSNILLQTGFNCNLSTLTPVAMTNSYGLVNLLNIIAFCYFDKSIMSWFTYALRKIFIGTFYTKLSLVYINKASAELILMAGSHDLNDLRIFWTLKLTKSQEDDSEDKSHSLKIKDARLITWVIY